MSSLEDSGTEAVEEFPPFVQTDADRERWHAAIALAERLLGLDDALPLQPDESPTTRSHVESAAKVIYRSEIATGDPIPDAQTPS